MCANRGTPADPSVGVGAVLATPVPAAAVGATGDVVGVPGDAGDGWGSPAGGPLQAAAIIRAAVSNAAR